ncbi:flagellar hook-associated protein 2 [Shouchella clausii]|uniref:flagellar filament capping protein FliD n=1 Tax=Shouchella clausii TaxID=79880 RepID=UPI001B0963B9|nr:flagellar filament capping protein FliD [Shouchella clausii]GIN06980.1 flagellar hook-associated protein 2 [Shouchella clausii]
MRLTGLASGLDIDQMMKDLMRAERIPVNKLEKQRTEIGWKTDAYREINLKMRAFRDSIFDNVLRASNMKKRTVSSSNSDIATATASSSVGNAAFTLNEVRQLATSATAKSKNLSGLTEKSQLKELGINDGEWVEGKLKRETVQVSDGKVQLSEAPQFAGESMLIINGKSYAVADSPDDLAKGEVFINDTGEVTFSSADKVTGKVTVEYIQADSEATERYLSSSVATIAANGEKVESSFFFKESDTISSVVTKLQNAGAKVNAFFDENSGSLVVTRKETGHFGEAGQNELMFSGALFEQGLGLNDNVEAGKNAQFTVNGIETERTSNTFTLSGMTITLKDTSTQAVTLSAATDVDSIVETIKSFVEEYNALLDHMNGKLNEKYYRDYDPLTDEERDQLTESEAKRWEEKAQSGLLRRDPLLQTALTNMRQTLYEPVDTGGAFTHLSQIGISTTKNYKDGGKLEIDENKLRAAIEEDADSVYTIFAGTDNNGSGIGQTLRANLSDSMSSLSMRAGGSEGYYEEHQFTLGKQTKELTDRIANFERRLEQKEARYWRQFTAMEKAMQMANAQSESLYNLLYGN